MKEYMIIITWQDCVSRCEKTDSVATALRVAAIHAEDPEIFTMKIVDCSNGDFIFDWWNRG